MRYYFLFVCILIISCNRGGDTKSSILKSDKTDTLNNPQHKPTSLDTIRNKIIAENSNYKDTATYNFSLDGNYSAEGNEGKAHYKNGKIHKIDITFYGEMGKSIYSYLFGNENINVVQKVFNYDSTLSGDIKSTKKVAYDINYKGELIISNVVGADTDTFFELKKFVPFTLK